MPPSRPYRRPVSGMIYAVIVVMWAAFLVPMWLRRHDEFAEAKSVDKFASKMRVLARRTGEVEPEEPRRAKRSAITATGPSAGSVTAATSVPSGTISSTVRIVGRERPATLDAIADREAAPAPTRTPTPTPALRPGAAERRRSLRDAWADDADDAALAALAAPDLARDLARDRGFGRAPASLAARRRRVLAALAGASLLLAGLAALSVAPWLAAGVLGVLTTTYVLHLRVQAKRTAEIARRRARSARQRPDRASTSAGSSRTARVAVQATGDQIGADLDADDGWQPVSVPVPTYVTAPRAGRAIRRIDLQRDDAWTSGRLVADAAAAGRAAAAAAHQESLVSQDAGDPQVRRAVGD